MWDEAATLQQVSEIGGLLGWVSTVRLVLLLVPVVGIPLLVEVFLVQVGARP
jgi:hypothetical protein